MMSCDFRYLLVIREDTVRAGGPGLRWLVRKIDHQDGHTNKLSPTRTTETCFRHPHVVGFVPKCRPSIHLRDNAERTQTEVCLQNGKHSAQVLRSRRQEKSRT